MADLIRELHDGLNSGATLANNLAILGERVGASKRRQNAQAVVAKILGEIDLDDPNSVTNPAIGRTLFDLTQSGPEGKAAADVLSSQLSLGRNAIESGRQERQVRTQEGTLNLNREIETENKRVSNRDIIRATPGGGSVAISPDDPTTVKGRVTPDEIDLVSMGLVKERERTVTNEEGDVVTIVQRPYGYVDESGRTVETKAVDAGFRLNAGSGGANSKKGPKIKVSIPVFKKGTSGTDKFGSIELREREDFAGTLETEVGLAKQSLLAELGKYTSLGLDLDKVSAQYKNGKPAEEIERFVTRIKAGDFKDQGIEKEEMDAFRDKANAWLTTISLEQNVRDAKEGKAFSEPQFSTKELKSLSDDDLLNMTQPDWQGSEEQASEAYRILYYRGVIQ